MSKRLSVLTNGLLKENPVLRLVLGTCPTLAVSTMASNGIGMGLAATFVLLCSNVVISALRKVIPDQVRIPCYITVIAGFVSVVQMLVKAYVPSLDSALGVYLPLIVVNCIILGRAEMFASKNGILDSALDGIGMGIGFTTLRLPKRMKRSCFHEVKADWLPVWTHFRFPTKNIGLDGVPNGTFLQKKEPDTLHFIQRNHNFVYDLP